MELFACFGPYRTLDFTVKIIFIDRNEALADNNGPSNEVTEPVKIIFIDGNEALADNNGPSNEVTEPTTRTVHVHVDGEQKAVSAFVQPSSQQLDAFGKDIEENDVGKVRTLIETNPLYLITKAGNPKDLGKGYNALHIAAIKGRGEISRLILQTISKPAYVGLVNGEPSPSEASGNLMDMYLNNPEKSRGDTPLHLAAKHGAVGVVKELVAYSQCRIQGNADGRLPRDLICSCAKAVNNTPEIRQAIRELLREQFLAHNS